VDKIVKVRIFRSNPARKQNDPGYQTYDVPIVERMSVLNVLQYINERYDGGLAYYVSCRRGLCSGCAVRVNGRPRLACTELVDSDITIEPISEDRVLKDLLTKCSTERAAENDARMEGIYGEEDQDRL
jgi:succinate dehydrogenase/fumarate reductase iron-sulfur protein